MTEQILPEPATQTKGSFFNTFSVAIQAFLILFSVIVGIQFFRSNATQPTSGPAPDFEVTTFMGETFRLSDLRGSIVVLNFWASWCVPCRDEAPILQHAWERYQDDEVVFVGIAYADTERKSLDFIGEFGITYPNGPDLRTVISEDYRITGVPETFVIDRDGNIVTAIIAPIQPGQLETILDDLLKPE